MRVKVLLFAGLRDLAGASEVALDLPGRATIADAWERLVAQHAGLEPYGAVISCARNAEYARMHTPLGDGDEVAFLPPVSGGAPHL